MPDAIKITKDNFEEAVLKAKLPVLVRFHAPWCARCRSLGSMLKSACADYEGRLLLAEADVDAEPELREKHGIISVPALVLYKNGRPAAQKTGMLSRRELDALLQQTA